MPIHNISAKNVSNFASLLNKYERVICLYHWTMCGHCTAFIPTWQKVTERHKGKINVINIEYEQMAKLDEKYKVNGFPAIVVYKNGKRSVEYTSARTEAELEKFIKKHLLDKDGKKV